MIFSYFVFNMEIRAHFQTTLLKIDIRSCRSRITFLHLIFRIHSMEFHMVFYLSINLFAWLSFPMSACLYVANFSQK